MFAVIRFDVGHVVSKVEVPVKWNIKSKELTTHLAEVGAQELVSLLPDLQEHLSKAYPQSSEGITKGTYNINYVLEATLLFSSLFTVPHCNRLKTYHLRLTNLAAHMAGPNIKIFKVVFNC